MNIRTANLTGSLSRDAGGLFESVRRLVQCLQGKGMTVEVFGTADQHTEEDIGAWAPVRVKPFKPKWPKKFGYSPEFLPALERFAPDLTHTHGLWLYSSVATNLYCRRRGVPYLISSHGMLDPWALRNSYWRKAVAHFFYEGVHLREASCLRALCDEEALAMRQLNLRNPIAVIPNGVDLPERGDGKAEIENPPWHGVLEEGVRVLLFLSRIHPKKGLTNLLRAWASVPGRDGWVLCIAGWDQENHESELRELCRELGMIWGDVRDGGTRRDGMRPELGEGGVLFLGPIFGREKSAAYAGCEGFVLPSFSEGLPMVVLEAWAHAKPVLMTPQCNLAIGFDRAAALRVEPTPESIGRGLVEFLSASDGERAAMGARGRELVGERFTWDVVGREMAKLYGWMLGGGQRPDSVAIFGAGS